MIGFLANRKHARLQQLLSSYIDGQVEPAELEEVQEHLAACDSCRQELDTLRFTVSLLRELPEIQARRSFTLAEAPTPVRRAPSLGWSAGLATSVAALLVIALLLGDVTGVLVQTTSLEVDAPATIEQAAAPFSAAIAEAPVAEIESAVEQAPAPVAPAAAEAAPAPAAAMAAPAPAAKERDAQPGIEVAVQAESEEPAPEPRTLAAPPPLTEPSAMQASSVVRSVEVELLDEGDDGPFAFAPKDFTFTVGEVVNFRLASESVLHTFTVNELGIDVAVEGGEAVEFTHSFDEPGIYKLICIPHLAFGMDGTISVEVSPISEAGPAPAPATPAPREIEGREALAPVDVSVEAPPDEAGLSLPLWQLEAIFGGLAVILALVALWVYLRRRFTSRT